jgi:hypothetical protein
VARGGKLSRARDGRLAFFPYLLEVWADDFTERGEVRVPSAASEQGATELGFQKLYRARQRWLGDSAKSRCARKIPFRADGQEIFDLVHFHNGFHSLLCVCSLDSVFSRQTTIE